MGVIEAILYGIVQGLTEFLPVSSTAHLRILPTLLNQPDPGSAFTAVIQLGTLAAVLIYFRTDLFDIFSGWVSGLMDKSRRNRLEYRLGWGIFYGTLPIIVLGFLFKHQIQGALRSLYVVAVMLILMGIVLLVTERQSKGERKFEDLTVKDGIWVGLWQAIALIPGASRSGSTLSGAFLTHLDKATAARFSFLLSVPSVLAAGLFEVVSERKELMAVGVMPTLIATFVSFVVGYASIALLLRVLRQVGVLPFVIWRVVVGLLLLGLIQAGKLNPDPLMNALKGNVTGGHRAVP